MTESDLQTLRMIVTITAMRTLLRECFIELAAASPDRAGRYRKLFARLRSGETLALKGIDPALKELASDEYQAALDELLSYVESGLPSELSSDRPRTGQGQVLAN